MKPITLIIMLLGIGWFIFCAQAADSLEEKATISQKAEQIGDITILKQDSSNGFNISGMNTSFPYGIAPPNFAWAQATKFTAPRSGWILSQLFIGASYSLSNETNKSPEISQFAIEIRDANKSLLYHFSDIQLAYFNRPNGYGIAAIDIPGIQVEDDFFVCFYGYKSIGLAAELQNATGNSYWYDRSTDVMYHGELPLRQNKTLPVNWIIWAAGK